METKATAAVEGLGTNASPMINPPKDPFSPFHSNIPSEGIERYEFEHYKVPRIFQQPMSAARSEFPHTDVGHRADPEKKSLLSVATEIDNLTPAIGTRLGGIDLRNLANTQKDELYAWAFGVWLVPPVF